mgnify:CR=1 FL=1
MMVEMLSKQPKTMASLALLFHLVDCAEAEAHMASYGIGNEGVCWMLVGYACGYTSAFMGRPILWRECECRSMGHEKCRVIGKPVEEWEDAADDLLLNEIVWRTQSTDFWVAFKVWGVMPLTMAFALAQTPLILKHEIKPAKTDE